MRRSTAKIDQVIDTWRTHGSRRAAGVVKRRAMRAVGRWMFKHQYPEKVVWGSGVQLRGKVNIRGEGTVIIGDHVVLDGVHRPVDIVVSRPESVIEIGRLSCLSGSTLIAAGEIRIGEGTILAPCLVFDNDWHSTQGQRINSGAVVDPGRVTIGDNVWIAHSALVARGVTIGDNAVIGAGAVLRIDVPADATVVGNPQRIVQSASAGDLFPARRSTPPGTGPVDLEDVVTLIEDATKSIPGTIGPDTRLDDPDLWDSLSVMEMLEQLEAVAGVELVMEELAACLTARQLHAEVERRRALT